MGSIGRAVSHAVSNIAATVKTVVTTPSKANIGQIASVIVPVPLTLPVDAAQHKEDRPILAVATAAAIGTGAFLGSTAGASTLATLEGHAVAAGTTSAAGGATALTLATKTPGIINSIEQALAPPGNSGGNQPPPSFIAPPPDFGISGGGGVTSTGDAGGGNVYTNPFLSGTLTPQLKTTYLIGGGLFLLLLIFASKRR